MATYEVTAARDSWQWTATIPGLSTTVSAGNLVKLEQRVRQQLADQDADLEWSIRTGDEQTDRLTRDLRRRRADAGRLADDTAHAVLQLVRDGWSVRDVGPMLGITYQRVALIAGQAGP